MAEVDTSIYKQPQQNPLASLTSVLGIIGQNNQNQLFNQTFQARLAVGDAYKAAIQPDGTLDQPTLMSGLAKSGFGAGEATGQGIANTAANFNLNKARNDYIVNTLGAATNDPNLTGKGAAGLALSLSKNAGIPPAMVLPFIKDVQDDPNPQSVQKKLAVFQNQALGTAGASRVQGPPEPGTGAPRTVPLASQTGQSAQVALPPGVGEGAVATGGQSGQLLAQDRSDAANYRRQVFPLEQSIPALERLGTTGTGPGKDEINQIKSAAVSFGFAPKNWTGSVKDFDEAKKYLTDWVTANSNNTGSNDRLAAAFSSNASTKISNAAAVDVAKSALALRRMKQAQVQEFEASGKTDSEYAKWATNWNAGQDPRAYGFDLMSPAQRTSVLKSLPPAKRALFMTNVQRAEDSNILSAPK